MTKPGGVDRGGRNTKTGRPPFEVTPAMLVQMETMAGLGLTVDQIADVLGTSERTLFRRKAQQDAVLAAWKRGRAKAQLAVGEALFKKAKTGDVPAIRWWEMTRAGRAEKTEVSVNASHEEALDELQ